MKALGIQLKHELERFNAKSGTIDTLFIGGGTPSTVHPNLYSDIFDILRPYMSLDAEITTEANPNSATQEWISGMKELGVNRMSFGVQSFNANKLNMLNRAHSPKQAIDAIVCASEIGIRHISLDLIYNFKGDTVGLLTDDIDQAFLLPIDHISAYELTIEKGTKFFTTPQVRQEDDEIAFFVRDQILKRGFMQYEISNYGKYQSRHNLGYWKLKDYMGVGAGAVGFLNDTRYYPRVSIDGFIENPIEITTEILDSSQILTEKIFLGLRSNVGVEKSILSQEIRKRADFLCRENKLSQTLTHYYNMDYFLSDELVLYLIA